MDIDFNDSDIGKKFFPLGCKCGSEVVFLSASEYFKKDYDGFVFACSNPLCDCYVKSHKISTGVARINEPVGILADKELRSLHELVRMRFSLLWQKRLINHLLHEYIVAFSDEDGETKYGKVVSVDQANKVYLIQTEINESFTVPISRTSKTDSRSRSYYWLAQQMNKSVYSVQIGMLNTEESCAAIDIIDTALKSINIKEDEHTESNG